MYDVHVHKCAYNTILSPIMYAYTAELTGVHHAFVYHGNWRFTDLHNAAVSDAFLQIANTKRWTFTTPQFTPFCHPFPLVGHAMFVDIRDGAVFSDRIPHITVLRT